MELKELYENETGKDPWFQNEVNGTYGLTQDYVEWLEAKINRYELRIIYEPKK